MKTAREILVEARQRISDPARWVQHDLARNAQAQPVMPDHPEAVQWCAIGSFQCSSVGQKERERYYAHNYLSIALWDRFHFNSISFFNDTQRHEDVLKLFDEAIRIAEIEEEERKNP